ncbi:MAG: right-handed parallel beta-helix repeat-containing protein [Methanomassiliicoccales archaeon]
MASGPVVGSSTEGNATDAVENVLAFSDVIRVNNDSELAMVASSGSGIIADPFVIEDLVIDATGHYSGIFIGNTTAHLIIRGCNVSGASGDAWEDLERGDAIMLYYASNITVENCSGHGCTYGLDIFFSNNVTGRNNIFYSLTYVGIVPSTSHDILLENNVIWSTATGIGAQVDAYNVVIRNNHVSMTDYNGIGAWESTFVIMENNNLSNNAQTGISLGSNSAFCWVSNNTCNDNGMNGISLWGTNNITVTNNSVSGNNERGIGVAYSSDDIVHNNFIDGNGGYTGIELESADRNRISGNYLTEFTEHGIILRSADYNVIENNTMVNVLRHIFFDQPYGGGDNNYNLISNNTLQGGSIGVYFWSCSANYNVVTNNLFTGFTNPGLSMDAYFSGILTHNQITFNTFRDIDWNAISIGSTGTINNNSFYGNAFINCDKFGYTCADQASNIWNSSDLGNYWDSHTSPDANYDGIVDTSVEVEFGTNVDHLPLVSPLWITAPSIDGSVVELNELLLNGKLVNHWDAVSFNWSNSATGESGNCTPEPDWSCAVRLAGGENDIAMTMVDVGGRHFTDNITVINTLTTLTMDPENGATVYTRNGTIDLTLNVSGYWPLVKATVEHSVNGDLVNTWINDSMAGQSDFDGVWTLDVQEGENYFLFWFDNSMGGYIAGVLFVIRDLTAPTIAFTMPGEGGYLSTSDVYIEWTVDDATEIATITYALDSPTPVAVMGNSVTLHDLEEGAHVFVLNATDMCGNYAHATLNFTVDLTKPYLEITSPEDGTLFGGNDVLITFSADDALSAIEYLQYRLDDGDWNLFFDDNISLVDLPDGEHTVDLMAADAARNLNYTSVSFTVDTTAPVVTITAPIGGGYSSNRTVTWTVDDVSGANLTQVSTDNANWTTITGTSRTFMLADGTYNVYVRVTDRVGLVGTDSVTFTIDTLTPTVDIVSPTVDAYNNTGSVRVTWNAADANGIAKTEVSKDGSSWSTVTGTSTTLTGLTDGTWTLYVRVTDPAGNMMTDSAVVGVSLSGPSVGLLPDETVITSDDSVDITANISGAVPLSSVVLRVRVAGELMSEVDLTADVLGDRTALITSTVELSEGVNVISLTVNDSAGNSVVVEVTVILDTVAPTLVIGLPSEGELLNVTAGIAQWTVSDGGSGLNNTWARMDDGAWTELGSAEEWTFTSLADGEHTLFVRADDRAGNFVEGNVTFIVDATAPTAEVSPTGDDLELDSVVVIVFSEQMNVTSVSVIVDGATGNVTWKGTVLTFTPTALEYATDYLVTVSGKDLAGNAMEMNWTFTTTAGTGSLTGTLVDEDGEPMANVTVHVGDRTAVTNELGRFVLNDLAPGNYLLTVDEEGYEMFTDSVAVTVGEANELGDLTLVAEGTEDEDDGGNSTILIIVAAVAIIAVAGAAVVFLKRRP